MKLVACLSFYDEQPDTLKRCATSLVNVGADHLLALDGPYALYPHAEPRTNEQAIDCLRHATRTIGLTLHQPNHAWQANELEKRNTLFRIAHQLATPGTDWLMVIDADMTITRSPGDLHAILEHATEDVATARLYGDGNDRPHRMLFRAQRYGIHLHGHHANYMDGQGRTLWNPVHPLDEVPALHIEGLEVEHRPQGRASERNQARSAYYDRARDERIEING